MGVGESKAGKEKTGMQYQRMDRLQLRQLTESSRGPREVTKSGFDVTDECPNNNSVKG